MQPMDCGETGEILVVDDEKPLREGVALMLSCEGFAVRTACNGRSALDEIGRKRPDLVLLDVMMPKMNGFAVLAEIRRHDPALPVLILSARTDVVDKVHGLDLGADDYVDKAIYAEGGHELVARIRAALRRSRLSPPRFPADVLSFGASQVDVRRHVVTSPGGAETVLSASEMRLLKIFASRPGENVTRDELFSALWGVDQTGNPRAIDQTVKRVREKLGSDGACIVAKFGVGYRYEP